jgi:spore germination protein
VNLIAKITERLNQEGFWAEVTIMPSTFEVSTGITYLGVDYSGLSQAANNVLYQLTYAWRAPYTLPISILPFKTVTQTLHNAVELIIPKKCTLGISNVGYLWEFPYFAAVTDTKFLNYSSAIELANDMGSVIQFNEPSRSSYFDYIENEREYMAWFKDVRAIYPLIAYSQGNELQGISLWNIMFFVTNIWLLIHSQYIIEKV